MISQDELRQKILAELKQAFFVVMGQGPGTVTETTSMKNFPSWNASNHLALIMEIEKRFNTRFNPADMASMTSVQAIVALLLRPRTP